MKSYILILLSSLFLVFTGEAQTLEDAIRFSTRDRIGSARGFGTGGAMSSIGGDYGSLAANPAGIGMFKRSEFQISPGFFYGPTESTLENGVNPSNASEKASRSRFMIPSISYVKVVRVNGRQYYGSADTTANYRSQRRYGWTRGTFAVGINRVANFNRRYDFEGQQDFSITQLFIEESGFAFPDNLDDFIGGPAYDAFLTTYDEIIGDYFADIEAQDVVTKSQTISQKGGIDEISFSAGGDYANKLQIGASINLPIYSFKEKKRYTETIDNHPIFNKLEYDQNLTIKGSGVNIKLGAKYIVAKKVHVAAAFHSPTWMALTEAYDTRAYYDYKFDPLIFNEAGPKEAASPLGEFTYSFRSPWRATGGVGVIVGQAGFISSEVEYVNYRSSKFTVLDDVGFENQLNNEIDFTLGSTLSLRVGGEVRVKSLRIRGGVDLGQNVYADESNFNFNAFSLGMGFWIERTFIDIGYRYRSLDQLYSPYRLSGGPSPIVSSALNENNLVITFGVKI